MRSKKGYQTWLHDFLKFDILVVCPQCSKKALVKTSCSIFTQTKPEIKFICTNCGSSKYLPEQKFSMYLLGAPKDPFFQLPLWLTSYKGKNILWAYNHEHLYFLKELVEAKLRERNRQPFFNKSLASKLPKWIISGKNRQSVLGCIGDLELK